LSRFGGVTLELLLRPGRFFERFGLEAGGVRLPVLYAICTHWLAAAIAYGWEGALFTRLKTGLADLLLLLGDAHELGHPGRGSAVLEQALGDAFREHLLPWFWGASSVLLSPFKTLAMLAWATGVLFVASRLLIPAPVSLKGSLRIGEMPHGGYRAFDYSVAHSTFPGFRFKSWRDGLSLVHHRQQQILEQK
jgi:hypothetical protein